jgi:hypothetical protein
MPVIYVPYNWSPVTARIFVNRVELLLPQHTDSQGTVISKRYINPTIRHTRTGRFTPIPKERFKELIEMGQVTDVTLALLGDRAVIHLSRYLADQHGLADYFPYIWMTFDLSPPTHLG